MLHQICLVVTVCSFCAWPSKSIRYYQHIKNPYEDTEFWYNEFAPHSLLRMFPCRQQHVVMPSLGMISCIIFCNGTNSCLAGNAFKRQEISLHGSKKYDLLVADPGMTTIRNEYIKGNGLSSFWDRCWIRRHGCLILHTTARYPHLARLWTTIWLPLGKPRSWNGSF